LSERTKLVILNSPENPTGEVLSRAALERIAEQVRNRDVMVLSDEIYSRIYYGEEPGSIASLPGMQEKTIILDGFSKTYAMTGWRIGYGVMPEWLVEAVNKLMVNSNSCTATFTQRAALAALTGPQDEVTRMVAEFHKRRDAFCAALNEIKGFRCPAWPDITATGRSSKEMADVLLNEAGVACLNGASFGARGEGRIRFSYANSLDNLLEAAERIRRLSLSF
jgi:aspartate aminotransferase